LIEEAIGYSDKIVNELLDYSRELKLEPTETTLGEITTAALHQVRIPENVLVRDLTQNGPVLLVDTAKIQRVFVNLVKNAVDAMPEGGELVIRSSESNDICEITFADSGRGIPQETLDQIWRPLYTTKAKGIGLGLAICKRIVEAHGGSITANSAPGKGSTFAVTLPIGPKARRLLESQR
jgi:signal transduction histidine kinase